MDHEELTEKIIGCAYRVHNTMGAGFLESVYEKCLAIEFGNAEIRAEFQKPIDVYYLQQNVGSYVADALIEEKVILELKAVRKLSVAHEIQLVNYLTATKLSLGLLINFGDTKVEIKRKVLNL